MSTISATLKNGQGGGDRAAWPDWVERMHVVAVSNDLVRISFLTALLADAGIRLVMLDGHVSATEGSIGAIPRRLAVSTDDAASALRILREAGEA